MAKSRLKSKIIFARIVLTNHRFDIAHQPQVRQRSPTIGDHALSYKGWHSELIHKILMLLVRDVGIRDIAEIERINIKKVLSVLVISKHTLKSRQSHYDSLEVDEFWTYVGKKAHKVWLIYAYHRATGEIVAFGCRIEYDENASSHVICAHREDFDVDEEGASQSAIFKKLLALIDVLKAKYGFVCGDINWSGIFRTPYLPHENQAFSDTIGII